MKVTTNVVYFLTVVYGDIALELIRHVRLLLFQGELGSIHLKVKEFWNHAMVVP